LKNIGARTGNDALWFSPVETELGEIASSIEQKKVKKGKNAKTKLKKEENASHRDKVHETLKIKFGGPEEAAAALKMGKINRRASQEIALDEVEINDRDTDNTGSGTVKSEALAVKSEAEDQKARQRSSKTDLLRAEALKEERKLLAEQNREKKLEAKKEKQKAEMEMLKTQAEMNREMLLLMREMREKEKR
jgi:hypothetical protein